MSGTAEIIAKAGIVWMDTFANIGPNPIFSPGPSMASWEDYSRVEQSMSRFMAASIIEALRNSGYEVVPKAQNNQTRQIDAAASQASP